MRLLLLLLFFAGPATAAGAEGVKSGSSPAPGTSSSQASPALANHQKSAETVVNVAQRAVWSFDIPAIKQILTDGVKNLGFLAIEAQERNGSTTFAAWRDDDNKVQFAESRALPDEIRQQAGLIFTRPLLVDGKEFGRLTFYLNATTGSPKLTDAERAYLTKKGVIRMCVPPDWLPYLGIDEQGRVAGIGADLVALMQERLGVKFELHPTREWSDSLAAIRRRDCDILPLASDLPERRAAMNFTRPYLSSPFVVATRIGETFIRDGSEIGERKIGIVKAYSFAALLRQHYPNAQVVDVKSTRDGLDKVSKGEIWGYLDAIDSIAYALRKHSMHDLKINGKLEFGLDLSLASRNDEQALSAIMQKATDSIGEEERRAIINKWIAVRFEQGVDYALLWKLGGAAALLLLAAYAWNRRLARFNKDLGLARSALQQTANELETILEHAWIGVFVTSGERKVVRMNSYAAAEVFRCQPDEYIGVSTRSMFSSDEDYEVFTNKVRAADATNISVESTFCRKDGSPFLAKAVGSLLDPSDPRKGAIWLLTDITEQRAAEEKLAKTLNELDVIFNIANVGIVFLVNRRFVRVNRTFETIFGWPADELLGQDTRRFYVSDEAYEAVGKASRELPSGEATLKLDMEMHRADGSDILCEGICSYVDPSDRTKGVVWLFSDVTEQRAAADKLTKTLGELDIIFNNAKVGIAFLVNRRFARVNRTFETMFGWSSAELMGQTARRLHASDEAFAAVGKAIAELPAGEPILRVESAVRRADGSDILCEAVSSYVDPSDRSKGVVWLFTDVTELRQAQALLQNARDDALAKKALIEQQHQLVTRTLDQVARLLNNSGQGFLSFGRDLMIEEGFSRECQRIFGRDVLDLPLPELLCPADAGRRGFLEKTLRLILGSAADPLRRDAYLGLLPAEYRLGERYCKAEYRLLDDGRMMLILTDVSDQKQLEERLALERLRLEFVVHALESRDDLLEMLRDFELFRSRGLPDLLSFERQPRRLLDEVFRQVHTFKSLFAQASLPTIPEVLHELESRLGQLRDSMDGSGANLDTNAIKHALGTTDLGAALDKDIALLREKLGDDFFNSEREIRVPASKLAGLEAEASTLYGSDSRMLELIRYLRHVPLQSLIEPHFKAAEQLAERQEKLLAPITCMGKPVLVDPETYGPFCKSLVHLFRNAVDHGIEDVDTRLMVNKDETATIRCEVRTTHDHLSLTIADDGRGIDAERIRAKAIEQGRVGAGETASISDADTLLLIFADGVTTSEEISTISGRGVGLGAVQQELMHIGGTVRVESTFGQGARFEFTLPYQAPAAGSKRADIYEDARKILAPLPGIVKSFCETHLKLEVTVDATLHEFTADGLFDFTALLSLGSGLNACIGLSIERPLLREMTRRFEPDFPEEEIEELADSVGAEIANTIVGNATVYFTHLARHVAMGTPDIVAPNERAAKIGSRLFRGFTGHGTAGAFMVFCILSEENSA